MPETDPPSLFVITNRGQIGPFTRAGLREALELGQVSPGDQVRTAFGSPLGTVVRVMERQARAAGGTEGALAVQPPAPARRTPLFMAILVLGVLAMVFLVGGFLLYQPTERNSSPIVEEPVVSAEPHVTPAASESENPGPEPADAAYETAENPIDPYIDLLPGRRAAEWQRITGGSVQDYRNAYRISFMRADAWVRADTMQRMSDFSGSNGLAIYVRRSTARQMLIEVIEDGSGRRFVASCDLQPNGCMVRLPWTSFIRDQEQHDPPHDGLQLKAIRSIGFQQAGAFPVVIQISRVCLYR
jgi:hypothetical protein